MAAEIKEVVLMKLVGDLKDKVEKAENQEEAKKIINWTDTSQPESNDIGDCICEEESKMDNKKKLTDDELDEVAGGFGGGLLPEDMFRQVG